MTILTTILVGFGSALALLTIALIIVAIKRLK